MGLSELTNKELKNILRENQVKNYSKLNKKDLIKKVNKWIKQQNGGQEGSQQNNSFLPELPKLPEPLPPAPPSPSEFFKKNKNSKNVPSTPLESQNVALVAQESNIRNNVPSAPFLNKNKTNENTNIKKEECGPCSIL